MFIWQFVTVTCGVMLILTPDSKIDDKRKRKRKWERKWNIYCLQFWHSSYIIFCSDYPFQLIDNAFSLIYTP